MGQFSLLKTPNRRVPIAVGFLAATVLLAGAAVVMSSPRLNSLVTGTSGPVPTPSPTREVVPSPKADETAKTLAVGRPAAVYATGSCLNVRDRPSVDAAINFCLKDGTVVSLIEGPVEQGGNRWWRIREYTGWAVETFLKP